MKNLKLLTWVMIVGIITACSGSDGRGFTKTESGIQYKVHVKGDGPLVQLEDILSMDMVYRTADSVVFDSKLSGMPMYMQLTEPEFPGDIYEALALMSVGDSTTFMLDAEKFFIETAGMLELPEFIMSGDILYFDVKMNAAMDEDGFAAEQEKIMEKRQADAQKRAEDEGGILDQYLLDNNISVEARASGLYYIEKEKGTGAKVEAGQTVSVHYEGRLLDGTVFDSSLERDTPLDFVVGAGQVIPGWDEGIGLMNVGGKATLIIPSFLGYGERGAGQVIPPFSSLVFEVEVVDAK